MPLQLSSRLSSTTPTLLPPAPLQIVEQGTHAELVEKDGLYAEMWRRQQETAAAASSSTSRPASTLSLSQMPGAQD